MNFPFQKDKNGQTLLEYSLVIGLVVAIITAMGPYIGRSTKGMIKLVADEIGLQNEAEQNYNDSDGGFLEYSYQTTNSQTSKTRNEGAVTGELGVIEYVFDDRIGGTFNRSTNLGIVNNF